MANADAQEGEGALEEATLRGVLSSTLGWWEAGEMGSLGGDREDT